MIQRLDLVSRQMKDAAAQVATKSAMNPILWICVIVVLPAFTLSYLSEEPYKYWFFLAGLAPISIALISYCGFAVFSADRLQSEDFRLRNRAITVFGDSSGKDGQILEGEILITPESIQRKLEHQNG